MAEAFAPARVAPRTALLGFLVAAMLGVHGCSLSRGPVDHTISWENRGPTVTAFQIHYGDVSFPRRVDEQLVERGGKQATVTVPVPDEAMVEWTSTAGNSHSERVAIYSKVREAQWFDGSGKISFEIDDETLRVYLIRQMPRFKEERTQIH